MKDALVRNRETDSESRRQFLLGLGLLKIARIKHLAKPQLHSIGTAGPIVRIQRTLFVTKTISVGIKVVVAHTGIDYQPLPLNFVLKVEGKSIRLLGSVRTRIDILQRAIRNGRFFAPSDRNVTIRYPRKR